jgi:threonine dehydratase
LKLENLQPIGSFKIRGAGNAVLSAPQTEVARGLVTTSTGNMAQGVAWMARELGVRSTIIAPHNSSPSKLAAVERMGGRIVHVSWDDWWAAMEAGGLDGVDGYFVHPVRDERVMAGNGTIGLELTDDLDAFDTVVIPWGGGGLTTGIASALEALRPETRVVVAEPETGCAVTATIANGRVPTKVEYTPSFIDGAGSGAVLPDMWERASPLVSDAFAIPLADAANAVRVLVEKARIVAEGAAGLGVAAALAGHAGSGRVVCIVCGGNIEPSSLRQILDGRVPS